MDQTIIVAHRGGHSKSMENSKDAFMHAIELGADAIEFDIRLTKDKIPLVFNYFYLSNDTASDPIFKFTYKEIQKKEFYLHKKYFKGSELLTLDQLVDLAKGKINLEIEVKGPEKEASLIIAEMLQNYKSIWNTIEITSYEPVLLLKMKELCPDIPRALLLPKTESWMKLDVVTYNAIHRTLVSEATSVHLHPTQINEEILQEIRSNKIEVHAWDVNDEQTFTRIKKAGVKRICTDKLEEALIWEKRKETITD